MNIIEKIESTEVVGNTQTGKLKTNLVLEKAYVQANGKDIKEQIHIKLHWLQVLF